MTKTPFHNKKGEIVFKCRPMRDICFIYPIPPKTKLGKVGIIEIPTQFIHRHQKPFGVLLAVGPGYYSKDGKFHKTTEQLKIGVKVQFDLNIPWRYEAKGQDGKAYQLAMCGVQDISCVVEEK